MAWADIPLIEDGVTTFSAQDINPIINRLTERTDILKERIINESILNGVGFSDIGLESCQKGQFVAYDQTTKKYIPASAVWNPKSEMPDSIACIIGLLISDVVDGRGTVLTSGIIRNSELIETITGITNPPAGEYYLTTVGGVTSDPTKIVFPIHCGSLVSTGCFVLGIQIPDFRTHTHTKYEMLSDAWEHIETADYSWKYNSIKDPLITTVLKTFTSGMVLVVNNKVLFEDIDYIIDEDIIYIKKPIYNDGTSDLSTKLNSILFATNPFTGVVPWITNVDTVDNSIINIAQSGSSAIIGVNFPIIESTVNNGQCIATITPTGVCTADIVNNITPGPGIILDETEKGTIKISSAASLTRYVDLNIMNGSGIIYGGDNDSCCIKFPAGRTAHLAGSVRAPNDYSEFVAKAFVYIDNVDNAINLNAHITTMTASETEDIVKNVYELPVNMNTTNSSIVLCTTNEFKVKDNSLVAVDFYTTNPTSTITVRSCGVLFTTE